MYRIQFFLLFDLHGNDMVVTLDSMARAIQTLAYVCLAKNSNQIKSQLFTYRPIWIVFISSEEDWKCARACGHLITLCVYLNSDKIYIVTLMAQSTNGKTEKHVRKTMMGKCRDEVCAGTIGSFTVAWSNQEGKRKWVVKSRYFRSVPLGQCVQWKYFYLVHHLHSLHSSSAPELSINQTMRLIFGSMMTQKNLIVRTK